MNLWKYGLSTKKYEQLTSFKDYDIHFPSAGPDDIVFEQGGKLYLFSFASQQLKVVPVNVVTDKAGLKPKSVSPANLVQHVCISPDGNRVIVEARGDLFSLPAENGFIKNITHTVNANERYPAWSPDGNTIAYWSDQSGEYELWMAQPGKDQAPKKLPAMALVFGTIYSGLPDSKKLIFIDQA